MLAQGSFQGDIAPAAGARVGAIASRALRVLAARRTCSHGLSEGHVIALHDIVLRGDREARLEMAARMIRDGIDEATICDHYIPEVARRLGAEWCEDARSFAEVTIGTARLQSLLHDVEPGAPASMPQDGRRVAVIVPGREHHTLGAMVLTGQLRRRGVSARLVLGQDAAGIADALSSERLDAALISVAPRDRLDDVRGIVAALRHEGDMPVIVGGGILERGPQDVLRETGADHATCDIETVLELCHRRLAAGIPG